MGEVVLVHVSVDKFNLALACMGCLCRNGCHMRIKSDSKAFDVNLLTCLFAFPTFPAAISVMKFSEATCN